MGWCCLVLVGSLCRRWLYCRDDRRSGQFAQRKMGVQGRAERPRQRRATGMVYDSDLSEARSNTSELSVAGSSLLERVSRCVPVQILGLIF